MKRRILGAVVLAIVACGGDTPTDPITPIGLQLSLSPSVDTLFVSAQPNPQSSVQMAVSATSQSGTIQVPSGRVFNSQNPTVATVDSVSGLVTAVSPGTADVTVRVNGVRGHSTIVVLKIVHAVALTATPTSVLAGDTALVTASLSGWHGQPVAGEPVTFTSSNPAATVSADGHVVFSIAGTTTVTATSDSVSGTATITALPRQFVGGALGSIATGMDATCGLLPLGRTYCFGAAPLIGTAKDTTCFDDQGAPAKPCTLVPLPIARKLQLEVVTVGDSVACGLDLQHNAYCWGDDTYGEAGNGKSGVGTATLPAAVVGPLGSAQTFATISAGRTHACGLTLAGNAYCWGKDSTYQLGGSDGKRAVNSSTPIPVGTPELFGVIAAGRGHTCAVRVSDGAAFCWGDNRKGQLGRGTLGDSSDVPAAIPGIAFSQISSQGDFTCGVASGGRVFCWGANDSGQTGNTSGAVTTSPAQVPGSGYVAVSAGWNHACALSSSGSVSCWGLNDYGQLGRGNVGGSSPTPTAVPGSFTAVSAGRRTSCAVAADGAYCWGSSILGAMGNQLQALAIPTPSKTANPQ